MNGQPPIVSPFLTQLLLLLGLLLLPQLHNTDTLKLDPSITSERLDPHHIPDTATTIQVQSQDYNSWLAVGWNRFGFEKVDVNSCSSLVQALSCWLSDSLSILLLLSTVCTLHRLLVVVDGYKLLLFFFFLLVLLL